MSSGGERVKRLGTDRGQDSTSSSVMSSSGISPTSPITSRRMTIRCCGIRLQFAKALTDAARQEIMDMLCCQ